MNRNLIMKQAINTLRTLAGNLLLAVAVNVFIRSFSMTAGGSTGLALIISHYLPAISFSLATTIVSWSCFFLGLLFLGMKFALTTLISTIGYPLFVQSAPAYYDDGEYDTVLLQLDCEDECGIIFGDAGNCYFLISKEDLKKRSFDNVEYGWQCC